MNDTLKTKTPRLHSTLGYIKDVWHETFPNEESIIKNKMQQRKKIAKLQKELERNELSAEEMERL